MGVYAVTKIQFLLTQSIGIPKPPLGCSSFGFKSSAYAILYGTICLLAVDKYMNRLYHSESYFYSIAAVKVCHDSLPALVFRV